MECKKLVTIEKVDNKITITYLNGEYSEWFFNSEKDVVDDELKAVDKFFNILADVLDTQIRNLMTKIGIGLDERGVGKHFFKDDV